jgi:hypothetical protein
MTQYDETDMKDAISISWNNGFWLGALAMLVAEATIGWLMYYFGIFDLTII